MTKDQTPAAASEFDPHALFLKQLKEQTREAHEQTELAVALPRRLETLETYRELLLRFAGLYGPLEKALRDCPACPAVAKGRLHKTDLLRQDLVGLGFMNAPATSCDNLPVIATAADCYGCLYVLEGSTLGGQIIRREVARRFPDKAAEISRFFQPYEEQTRPMWTDFCSSISGFAAAHPEAQAQVIAAARQTFVCFDRWLQ